MNDEFKELFGQLKRGEITRRDFIEKAFALGMTASSIGLLLHNAAPALAAGTGQVTRARRGGILRVADPGPTPGGLDPAVQQDDAVIAICHNIYNFLVRVDQHLIPYPDLATTWHVTPDAMTWTFPLHQGVKFHSGKPLTADDVIYSINRIKTLGLGGSSNLAGISRITKTDPYTVVFHLKRPDPDFPAALADYHMVIVENNFDPTMKAGYSKFTTHPSGTGPFMLKDFVPADHATLVRNPNYWQPPYPYLDGIRFSYLPQSSTQVAAVQSGQVDFVQQLSPTQAAPLVGAPGVKLVTLGSTGFLNMRMRSDRPPFNDNRVRQAFKLLVDRKAINQVLWKGLAPIGNDQPISPAFARWYTDIGTPSRNVARANALLAAAGYSTKKPLNVDLYASNFLGQVDFATSYQQMAADVPAINIKIISETWATYLAADWLKVDFGITSWGSRPTPQIFLNLIYRTGGFWNEGHYSNATLDALIDKAGSELDAGKRKSLYAQIARLIRDEGPSVLPTYDAYVFPLRVRVQGFKPLPDTFHYYRDAWLSS